MSLLESMRRERERKKQTYASLASSTFMHFSDTFIQNNSNYICFKGMHSLGIDPMTLTLLALFSIVLAGRQVIRHVNMLITQIY